MTPEVVVVGAGIAGSALAYYLSSGGTGVTVLERDYGGQGATGGSAGLLTVQLWNPLDVLLALTTQDISREFLGEGRGGFERAGFLRVTRDDEDISVMRKNLEAYRKSGIRADLFMREELGDHFPSIRVDDLAAGLYTPDDGFIDAYDLATAFLSKAREGGAVMRPNTEVTRIGSSSKGVLLETPRGEVTAELVILTAGAWCASLLRDSGLPSYLRPYRVQALVTAPLENPPDLPMFHELPEGYYFRPDQDSLLLGDGTEEREVDPTGFNANADFRLLSEIAGWISRRVPSLEGVKVARGWAGLCAATPDRYPLVGQVGDVEGLYVLAGFNGLGVMRAPPLAMALADSILGRKPQTDIASLAPDRFGDMSDFAIREGFTLQ